MAGATWYAFDFKDYASDTTRLSCEAHGAYIQMIADYYNTKEALPDDDFILAAVTKLPIETWKKHRKVLERYFKVADGVWRHERIESEIAKASNFLAASKLRAEAGGRARAKQMAEEREKKGKTPAKPRRSAIDQPVAQPAGEHQVKPGASRSTLTVDSLSTAAPIETDFQEGDDDGGIGAPIPQNWIPADATIERCLAEATQEEFEREVTTFVNKNLSEGGFSNNWNAAFSTWWIRFKDHRAKAVAIAARKAPPRIEVNAISDISRDSTIDRALELFARGGPWPRMIGPEPGLAGCKIPHDVIRKHGIDPATGLKLREPA